MSPYSLHGLYVITDDHWLPGDRLPQGVAQALDGGARLVQYRSKRTDPQRCGHEARAVLEVCQRHGAPLLVNDDIELAASVGADGVHLGQADPPVGRARQILGPEAVIGCSCHDSLQLALEAQRAGADYAAFGRFFSSRTKPEAAPARVDTLRAAKRQLGIAVVAIGGITPDNGASLIAAGADMLAVVRGVFGQPDIRAAAQRYAKLFEPSSLSR